MILSRLEDYEDSFTVRAMTRFFNSYYLGLGQPFTRAQRGLLTRPDVTDATRLAALCRHGDGEKREFADLDESLSDLIVLGLNHEQQHQELLLTDIKHAFSCNPLLPAYRKAALSAVQNAARLEWMHHQGGQVRRDRA